ncbi:MAG: aldehyde dehydrogenase family protein, partial [Acidimicrobiales bacterium]
MGRPLGRGAAGGVRSAGRGLPPAAPHASRGIRLMADYKLFINGEFSDAASGETFATYNPGT